MTNTTCSRSIFHEVIAICSRGHPLAKYIYIYFFSHMNYLIYLSFIILISLNFHHASTPTKKR